MIALKRPVNAQTRTQPVVFTSRIRRLNVFALPSSILRGTGPLVESIPAGLAVRLRAVILKLVYFRAIHF